MKRLLLLLLLILFASPVYAACTGSGTVWSCTAGASVSDVQTAINSASDGAVITFQAGSYTWGSPIAFSASAGATLICASVGGCTVSTGGATVLGMPIFSGTNTHFYRVSGFTFNQSANASVIWFGYSCPCTGTLARVRIDHNTFNLVSLGVGVFLGENGSVTNTYGVVDHNTMNSPGNAAIVQAIGAVNTSPPASPLGTGNNLFIEDNTITITTINNGGEGCMDSWGGAAIVFRHNIYTNCLVTAHGVIHNGGPANIEFYNNFGKVNAGSVGSGSEDGYRLFHHQGSGSFVAFNNSFTAFSGKNSEVISMIHYRDGTSGFGGGFLPLDASLCDGTVNGPADAPYVVDGNRAPTTTNRGYPCWRQPGRDFAGNLLPMYVWNNFWSDTLAQVPMNVQDIGGSPDYFAQHMQPDREWENAVSASAQTSPTSPFNGTTGMGFGTLANRPTTCTTFSEPGSGVGYFATDQGAQGTLYRCSATNTWVVQYTPFTYPHPLVTGGGAPPPAPPTNLRAVVN